MIEDDLSNTLDDELSEIESLTKSLEGDDDVDSFSDLLKSSDEEEEEYDDEEEDDDEEEEEYDEEDDDNNDIEKSFYDEYGNEVIDASEILGKSMALNKSLRKENRELKKMVGVLGDLSLKTAKTVSRLEKSLIGNKNGGGVQGGFKGDMFKSQPTGQQGGDKNVNAKVLNQQLMKGFKDGEVDRYDLVRFEQARELTDSARTYLQRTLKGGNQ